MTGKEYRQIIVLFIIFLVALNFFTDGSATEDEKILVRRKRNIICFFGLTGFISNTFYEAIQSARALDPLELGTLLNGKMEDSTLQGLSTLRNDSQIDVSCQGEEVILNTLMGLTDLVFSCEWSYRILLKFSGTLSATVEGIQFLVKGTFDMESGVVLDINVELTELDNLSFKFSGLGPLNLVVNSIGNMVLDVFQHSIKKGIGTVLSSTLKSELGKYQIKTA